MTRNEIQITLPEAAAGCLHKLYADELRQSLRPPVDPMVNAKQTRAMIRRARDGGPGLCEEPDPTTWIWSDLHLGHEDSLLTFDRPFRTPDDMDQAMRDAWYELVGVDDTIICLGDVGPDSSIRIDHQAWWREAPGAKWLVLGNHDVDRYQQPYDPDCPVVCMDEQPVQLVQETRPPVAATATRPRRVDYEYERAGTASVFLFSEPLAGWRQATARARRTKADWAVEVAGLLEGRYADCPRVTLVCDNLNTHTKGAFYEVFEPVRARELVRRLEFCHTPKHGSWLNIAENELSALTRQCLRGRRIGDLETLHSEVSAWSGDVNGTQRGVDWQMKVNDARCKLKSVYPKIVT